MYYWHYIASKSVLLTLHSVKKCLIDTIERQKVSYWHYTPVGEKNGTHFWKLCHSPCIFHKRQWDLGFLESIIFCTSFFETNAAVSFSEQSALAVKARPGTSIAKYLRERVWKPPQAIQSSRKQISILVDCQRPVDRDGRQRSTRPPGGSLLTRKDTAFTSVLLLQESTFLSFRQEVVFWQKKILQLLVFYSCKKTTISQRSTVDANKKDY